MAIIKCKMCGGDLNLLEGQSVAECEYCGTRQTVPTADNDKKITLFTRANRLRAGCDFDKAAGVYESIVSEFPEEAEAYWGLVLCKYGIEYVDDPATAKKVPTCHRSSFESIFDDANFDMTMEYADLDSLQIYRQEAKAIETIRQGIMEVSAKEEPYDIFICYKESDEHGDRTVDSVIAQDIYDELTRRDYRVFFARISLEDKLGVAYEPYIFAALNSAKIMLAVGSKYEYYNAVWVKNEWSRFLKLMAADKSKHLIPCYKNLDAYDIPREFSHLQAQDMGKVGALQDLLRGIEKLLPKKVAEPAPASAVVQTVAGNNIAPLLKRVFIFLEDGDWQAANEYAEKVLDIDPENADAYVGKLMASLCLNKKEELLQINKPFSNSIHYQKIQRYGQDDFVRQLKEHSDVLDHEAEIQRMTTTYDQAMELISGEAESGEMSMLERMYGIKNKKENIVTEDKLQQAVSLFQSIPDFKDATQQIEICLQKIEEIRLSSIYRSAQSSANTNSIPSIEQAIQQYESIIDYRDSREKLALCKEKLARHQQEDAEWKAKWQKSQYRLQGRCQHCGGEFKGLFSKACASCGKPKDY